MLGVDGFEPHSDFESVFGRRKSFAVEVILKQLRRSKDGGGGGGGTALRTLALEVEIPRETEDKMGIFL